MNELDVRTAFVWGLVVALFVAHFVLHIGLSYGRQAPDLLTLGLLIGARETSLGRAASVGLVAGLLEDAMSLLAFGANSIAMTLVGIGGAVTRDLFVGDSKLFLPAYVFFGKWVRDLVHWVAAGEGVRQPFVEQVVVQGSIGSVYVALIALVLSRLLGAWGEA